MPKVTQEQIAKWKKKHGEIYEVIVEDKTAYLHKPDRNTLKLAFGKAATDPLGMAEIVIINCWLGGDEEIKTDDAYFMGATNVVDQIIQVKDSELKKI